MTKDQVRAACMAASTYRCASSVEAKADAAVSIPQATALRLQAVAYRREADRIYDEAGLGKLGM